MAHDPQNADRGERALIRAMARHAQNLPAAPLPVPFGDDMAAVPADGPLLWTVDTVTDGVDFDAARHDMTAIGRKAMAVNLSDCAAMAAVPVAALCSLLLPESTAQPDALALWKAADECGRAFGAPIVGGDVNSWPGRLAITITVAARPDGEHAPVLRRGARPGDRLAVTGRLGGSILGRHMTFEPRVRLARELNAGLRVHAMIDISDGLAVDLWHLLDASGCGAVIAEEELEQAVHDDARTLSQRTGRRSRDHALGDGEDFELLVALDPADERAAIDRFGLLPLGWFVDQAGLRLRSRDGELEEVPRLGWEHLR